MQTYCDAAKGKEKTMCYYMGVGDKEQGTAGGVKREISGSFQRGINAKRLCTRLKKKDAQMCELRYEKKIDVKNTDLKKLRVKELRKILDDEGVSAKGGSVVFLSAVLLGCWRMCPDMPCMSFTLSSDWLIFGACQVLLRRTSSLTKSRPTLASRMTCDPISCEASRY
mmetsp:Transcript_20543/g.43417  ORF Transcript_20543/g.43417 Transcript_20543/m.43417 type:complete len:168 (+) Transcript_20543:494-997(+)